MDLGAVHANRSLEEQEHRQRERLCLYWEGQENCAVPCPVTFELQLPRSWKIHPVVHVLLFKPIHTNPFPEWRPVPSPTVLVIEGQEEHVVRCILHSHLYRAAESEFGPWSKTFFRPRPSKLHFPIQSQACRSFSKEEKGCLLPAFLPGSEKRQTAPPSLFLSNYMYWRTKRGMPLPIHTPLGAFLKALKGEQNGKHNLSSSPATADIGGWSRTRRTLKIKVSIKMHWSKGGWFRDRCGMP